MSSSADLSGGGRVSPRTDQQRGRRRNDAVQLLAAERAAGHGDHGVGQRCATEVDTRVEVVLSTQGANGTIIASAFSPVIPANDEEGNWTVMITVPTGTAPGTYDLQAFCTIVEGGSGDSVSALQVNPPAGNVGFITYTLANFVVTAPVPPATAPPTAPPGVGAAPEDAPPAPPVGAVPRTAG